MLAGINDIRGLLQHVGHSPNTQKKLTALGESLDSMDQQADLPEIQNFAKELMSEFMDDATAVPQLLPANRSVR